MSTAFLISVAALVWAPAAFAADRSFTGFIPIDPETVKDWPTSSLDRAYIPEAIDLSDMMPPPENQGTLGACVSYTVGYALRGYYSALEHKTKPGEKSTTPSPIFLHSKIYIRPGKCEESGSTAKDAIDYLKQAGVENFAAAPAELGCKPELENISLPKNLFSVKGGKIHYLREREKSPPTDATLDKLKQSLASGHPVAVGIDLFQSIENPEATTLHLLQSGEIYQGSLAPNKGRSGGHEMAVVGYDERRSAFRLMNSWSIEFGEGGFFWMSYDAMKKDLSEASSLILPFDPPRPQPKRPGDTGQPIAGTCSNVRYVSRTVDGVRVRTAEGFVQDIQALEELNERLEEKSIDSKIEVRPWPLCEALLTLQQPLDQPDRPIVKLSGQGNRFTFGQNVGFEVTTPNFNSFLYVIYLQADGTVVNLLPRRGPMRSQTAPRTVLKFGDGLEGRQKFVASAPAGDEAVIAIASRSPLMELEALENEKNGQFKLLASNAKLADSDSESKPAPEDRLYLSLLRKAMADMPDKEMIAREITADVAYVKISEK